jgi:hypothetical protein
MMNHGPPASAWAERFRRLEEADREIIGSASQALDDASKREEVRTMGGVIFGQLDDLIAKAKAHLPKELHAKLAAEVERLKAQQAAEPAEGPGTQAP